ncbi:MAG: hypothetical protein WCA55_16885, partial [Xanthobacteraceae bacterium]
VQDQAGGGFVLRQRLTPTSAQHSQPAALARPVAKAAESAGLGHYLGEASLARSFPILKVAFNICRGDFGGRI